jgi:hypothetical protein
LEEWKVGLERNKENSVSSITTADILKLQEELSEHKDKVRSIEEKNSVLQQEIETYVKGKAMFSSSKVN